MKIVRTRAELQHILTPLKDEGKTIGLVPTMGALHAGHKSLVDIARAQNDIVVVSVFVNPTQFNNATDLATYPRTETKDCELLESSGVDYAFIPDVSEMYPEPDTRVFELGSVAQVMEGAMRPGHFNGVAQIVSKLFDLVKPNKAYFGEKDFQQIAVIKKMIQLLGEGPEIVSCPIVRESDGLALSSRNVRLTTEGREIAPKIHRILVESVNLAQEGKNIQETQAFVVDTLNGIDGLEVEYYQIVDGLTMQPLNSWDDVREGGAVGCITVYCSDVRLIDNIQYI